ncbi:hypothetical protein [Actinomyces sp. MRS3W]|uniref:hypothetical protein n=1 Tax=Actinomyces sp. MRS3W TaxID=2800796 RepID=UPI0028FD2991|nr:hypothetical protein [Actinomyces sp. MRS3W]MDU0348282.1 hypothetical protein [Actinomyces sp. MRS3W]
MSFRSYSLENDNPGLADPDGNGARHLAEAIQRADAILIGAASGLSAAAGFRHYYDADAGFLAHFGDLQAKHGYNSSFDGLYHRYANHRERWAFIARIVMTVVDAPTGAPYLDLGAIVEGRTYHALTTNQDTQFEHVVPAERISAIQGDWRFFQCSRPCHDGLYDAVEPSRLIVEALDQNLECPEDLIPRCPRCGAEMEPWVRSPVFLEGAKYADEYRKVNEFIAAHQNERLLFLEVGVGRMTPMFIQEPFWNLTYQLPRSRYLTLNPRHARIPAALGERGDAIVADAAAVIGGARRILTGQEPADTPADIITGRWGFAAAHPAFAPTTDPAVGVPA